MTLPDDFNSIEHFQGVIRKVHNRQVRDFFSDVGNDEWESDITTSRASLRTACTIEDNDTLVQSLFKYLFYHVTVRRGDEFIDPCYGIPTGTYQQTFKFRPQIKLIFKEDLEDVDPEFRPLTMECSLRLMDEDSESLTNTKLQTLANKIKIEFMSGSGYKFHKGKHQLVYTDKDKGYQLKIYPYSVTEGKDLISKILDIQGHTPNWENLNKSENDQPSGAYPIIPPNKQILGKSKKQPRKRPVGWVRFQYAECHLWGLEKPVILADRIYRFKESLTRP